MYKDMFDTYNDILGENCQRISHKEKLSWILWLALDVFQRDRKFSNEEKFAKLDMEFVKELF